MVQWQNRKYPSYMQGRQPFGDRTLQRVAQTAAQEIAYQNPEARTIMFNVVTAVTLGCAIYAMMSQMRSHSR